MALANQPGVAPEHVDSILGSGPWLTAIAEHHLESDLGVDLMASAPDPWAAAGLPRPDESIGTSAPLFWLEWDCAAGRAYEQPLWSAACDDCLLHSQAPRSLRSRIKIILDALIPDPRDREVVHILALHPARLLHVAPLAPRTQTGTRLAFWVPCAAVVPWLVRMGWDTAQTEQLEEILFRLAPAHQSIGVQLEVRDGQLTKYLALESPLFWQGRSEPSMALEPYLPSARSEARARFEALRSWVADPRLIEGLRRQMYVKFTATERDWQAKAYAGITQVLR